MDEKDPKIITQEVTITPEAGKEIQRIRKENNIPDSHALRIAVKSGGCCGFSYLLAFDDKREEADRIFQTGGVTVIIDEVSLPFIYGTRLEFIDGPEGKGFRFDNPNIPDSCSCNKDCCE